MCSVVHWQPPKECTRKRQQTTTAKSHTNTAEPRLHVRTKGDHSPGRVKFPDITVKLKPTFLQPSGTTHSPGRVKFPDITVKLKPTFPELGGTTHSPGHVKFPDIPVKFADISPTRQHYSLCGRRRAAWLAGIVWIVAGSCWAGRPTSHRCFRVLRASAWRRARTSLLLRWTPGSTRHRTARPASACFHWSRRRTSARRSVRASLGLTTLSRTSGSRLRWTARATSTTSRTTRSTSTWWPLPGWAPRPRSWCRTADNNICTFNGPLSRTTRVSRYQKGIINLDFTEATDSNWQWHQQVCISLQTDNHTSTPSLNICPCCRPTNSIKALKVNNTPEMNALQWAKVTNW